MDVPKDMVIATGETRTIREFLSTAFDCIGIHDWDKYVTIDPEFYRPAEVDYLRGDSTLARKTLGWVPTVTFAELVHMMVWNDIAKELRIL